jgi:hypothetical protein
VGFWSTLAGIGGAIAAPFTGGASAWLIPALTAGGAAADALTSRRGGGGGGGGGAGQFGGGGLPELSEAEEQMLEALGLGMDHAGNYVPKFLDRADAAGGSAFDYYSGILEGDSAKRAEFMAPELEGMQRHYQSAISDIDRFAPRGGERDRALTMARLGRAGDTARIMSQARPGAAAALMQLSGQQGQIGGGLNQALISGPSAGLSFLSNRRQLGLQQSDLDYRQQRDLWDSIGEIAENVTAGIGKRRRRSRSRISAPDLTDAEREHAQVGG